RQGAAMQAAPAVVEQRWVVGQLLRLAVHHLVDRHRRGHVPAEVEEADLLVEVLLAPQRMLVAEGDRLPLVPAHLRQLLRHLALARLVGPGAQGARLAGFEQFASFHGWVGVAEPWGRSRVTRHNTRMNGSIPLSAAVLGVYAGQIRPMPGDGRPTAIFKQPLTGRARIGWEGLEADAQADRRVHGGT